MTTLLIGHRGVGKTTFLESLKAYARRQEIPCSLVDLDEEIEGETGLPISELWKNGEAAFRDLERSTLAKILARPALAARVIALGAGFEGPLPEGTPAEGMRVVWLRRETDGDGRIFLNRPRLNPRVSPFAEYLERFAVREQRFQAWAHEQLVLPEGYSQGLEAFLLEPAKFQAPFDFTLKPEHFRDWPAFFERRAAWNVRRFELRDDLLSEEQMEMARTSISAEKLLYSARARRNVGVAGTTVIPAVSASGDWALELGEPPPQNSILSLHERGATFAGTLKKFPEGRKEILKLAVIIESFAELRQGHLWWQQDPARRAFLPRSKDGRWRWYRSLFGPRMPVHFFREDEGSALDQPLLWQIQMQPQFRRNFAAVLGSPVHHSRSPIEHLDFFKEQQMPFVAIDIAAEEFPMTFPFLRELGLSHAAVTSPLKQAACEICGELSPEARALGSVNTLIVKGEVEGHNTDVLALRELKDDFADAKEIWLWGGGGVRSSVRSVWPQAKEISARQGSAEGGRPDLLIWAAGRSRDFRWPSPDVKPAQVFDLNYGDNSPGLEWAAVNNLPYQSGLKMFKLQADFQRRIWRRSF